jgi:hypothetical protein
MKKFKDKITLIKNSRGCYILDTIKGCSYCKEKPLGCYDNCYAQIIAKRYKLDFSNPISRKFEKEKNQLYLFDFHDEKHINDIIKQIKKINMPFVRIGEMGDPSENWEHTLNVCNIIAAAGKPIVIITKHWKIIPDNLLKSMRMLNLYVNTSVSAMDTEQQINHRLNQYNRLKPYCKSSLRIVSCDFNKDNALGAKLYIKQTALFKNENVIDTVFRPSANNQLVVENIINTNKAKFMRTNMLVSIYNKNAYLGFCNDCPDMCGLN